MSHISQADTEDIVDDLGELPSGDAADRAVIPVMIRWMIRRDLPQVMAIERRSFETPWTDEDFLVSLRQRNVIGMVAEDRHERVVGYVLYQIQRESLQILNIAVGKCFRRRTVGRQLIDKLKNKINGHPFRKVIAAETCERNLPAQLFFKANGFDHCSVIHGAYADNDEDAFRMEHHRGDGKLSSSTGVTNV